MRILVDADACPVDVMLEIRYVTKLDEPFWFTLDKHLCKNEFALKTRDKRGYVIYLNGNPVGVMRYNLFWDNTPFEQPQEMFKIKVLGGQCNVI